MKRTLLAIFAWTWVVLPFAWGLYELVRKASALLSS
jgi:hypothetical protein